MIIRGPGKSKKATLPTFSRIIVAISILIFLVKHSKFDALSHNSYRGRIQGGGDINTALGLLPDKLKTELALHVNLSVLKKVYANKC